ncbi:hypothetical protein [Rhodopseudomonas palustris]|uniref:hypothetical protein n=1 Tax=Rhodopseudomonas palustris TaxID=1076 RepID=UPI000AA4C09B|nr:hypothetical protein [Rhodopseudomonas palustris]
MRMSLVPVRIRTGDTIRIDGRKYIVGPPGDQVRVFTERESGVETCHTPEALLHMIRSGRITTDASFRALSPTVVDNLQVDWGAFTDLERVSAMQKYPFVRAVHDLPLPYREKSKHITPLIDAIMSDPNNEYRRPGRPSVRLVRSWYVRWAAVGCDIRALVDNHRKKGNRTPRIPEWMKEDIKTAIFKRYANELAGTKADAQDEAQNIILLRSEETGIALPSLGAKKVIGKHLVSRAIDKMELYGLTRLRNGKREADFLLRATRNGPICTRPLEEAEVDHTRLDLMVCDSRGNLLGRPWLTAIIDRFSRMILGFSLSFTPPSWVSVMEALRVALQPKDRFLASVCSAVGRPDSFEFDYPAFGPIERLFCDNGPEFRSGSMKETEYALNMQIVDLPRAAGHLKGRIESWLRSVNFGIVHKLPGTTKSNTKARGKYRSEQNAILTLDDVIWIITKWIVDVHHSTEHSQTGEAPLVLWKRGIAETGQPPAPPDDILVPLTGKIIDRKLGPCGVVWQRLRWNSNDFSALRNRIGRATVVKVRIDPMDLNTAYILDPTKPGERDAWVEGYLETDDPNISGMTLYQYEHYRERNIDARPEFDREVALARARAKRDIFDHVDSRKPPTKKKLPAKLARFVTDGRKASDHVRGSRISPDDSELPIGAHDHQNPRLLSPPPDERGPYRGRWPSPVAPSAPEPPVLRAATELLSARSRRVQPTLAEPDTTPRPRPKMVVKMRKN